LRTRIVCEDGIPLQVVAQHRSVELPLMDLRTTPQASREAEARRVIARTIRIPFDLSRDLMVRSILLRLADDEYILLLVKHHIASDGWSSGILWRELVHLYQAFDCGAPNPLQQLPIQYADYAVWQRNLLQGEVLNNQLSYWTNHLRHTPVLELPTDRPRPAIQTDRGARLSRRLPLDLTERLEALSRAQGATPYMLSLAAFQVLLHRYTGQVDFAVGSPIAGRTRAELEGLIGFFVNTLVLRVNLSGNPTFTELLDRSRRVAWAAYAHQDVPFERLVEKLKPERDLSRNPLFQVMLAYQNAPRSSIELPGFLVSPMDVRIDTSKFDLSLDVYRESNGLRFTVEYSTDLFDAGTIERMSGNFQTLLEAIAADPEKPIADLPILTAAETRQFLVEWNDTTADQRLGTCIHELFVAQAEKTPDAIAVACLTSGLRCREAKLTYRQLNTRANQLAHYLRELGVGPESPVGICMERSLEMIVAILGVLKAGGYYVPLDSSYPKERLAFILEDAKVSVLLTQQRVVADKFKDQRWKIKADDPQSEILDSRIRAVRLDTDWQAIARASEENPVNTVTAENLAYVIYTSGSTGQPKGVQISHGAVANFITAACAAFSLTAHDRLLQFHSIGFDTAAEEILSCLAIGATLWLRTESMLESIPVFLDTCRSWGITILDLPTFYWHELTEKLITESLTLPDSLRLVVFGGERAMPERLAQWRRIVGNRVRLLNGYGPTETTVVATYCDLTEPSEAYQSPREVPIGRPIGNVQTYVLDPYYNLVPVGIRGDLYIGGAGLARGYLNRADMTAEKFVPNPFSNKPNARLYKTGDLARYLPNGNIEYHGRIDDQVKIRGFRIELGEIETLLAQHPAVQDAVVLVREEAPGEPSAPLRTGNRLVAYLVLRPGQDLNSTEARAYLKQRLPDYMVPTAFLFLDTLPLTPNGKVDRSALPAPGQIRLDSQGIPAIPRTAVEETLAGIWAKLLGIKQVDTRDNFFDLGGHSLLGAQLFAQIEKIFGRHLPLTTLFQSPTIAELALLLEQPKPPTASLLIPYQTEGSRPPFFSVHFGDKNMLHHYPAALDQPWYGLYMSSIDGRRDPDSMEEMAADYIRHMQTIQREGPYFLGGYCFGAVLAFEIAQQLQRQGHEVEFLVLVAPSSPYPANTKRRLGLRGSINRLRQRFMEHAKTAIAELYLRRGRRIPHFCRKGYREVIQHRALRGYIPNRYTGRITLLRPAAITAQMEEPWRALSESRLEAYEIPGNHDNLFRAQNIPAFVEQLTNCLRSAYQDGDIAQ
jgi:aspartate racemase